MIALVEVEAALGVNRRTVELWVAAGRLHTHKFERDRRTYVKRADLEALMAAEPPARGRPGGWRKAAPEPAP